MLRHLRDGKSSEAGKKQAQQLENSAQELANILAKIKEVSRKQAICFSSCSVVRKTELDSDYQKLQLEKTQLLSKEPLLLHPAVQSSLEKSERKKVRRKSLILSLSAHAVQLDQLSRDIDGMVETSQKSFGKASNSHGMVEYSESVASRHRNVLETLVGGGFPSESPLSEQRAWCFYNQELNFLEKKDLVINISSEAALWGASFLFNPPAAVASRLLTAGSQTLKWGLRTGQTFQKFLANGTKLNRAEHISLKVNSRKEVAKSLASEAPATWAPNQSMVIYKVGSKENVAVMDLGRAVRLNDKMVLDTSHRYLEHLGETYLKRLNFSEKEIKDFIASSKEMRERTYLITSSAKAPLKASEFYGGVGTVISRKSQDLLPLEKATGIKVDRSKGGVAEIVRLTAQNADAKNLSRDLIDSVLEVLKNEKNIQTIYVYTSKAHARLYKSMGFPFRDIKHLENSRDVILSGKISDIISH